MTVRSDTHSDALPASERVVRAVSKHAEADPLDLPPLYHAVDPDALDGIVDGSGTGTVEFQYAGRSVTVDGDGTVDVAGGTDVSPSRADSTADD